MSGQLSPDGNYYWDGTHWASVFSPDGAWRWDGRAWQSSSASRRRSPRTLALIAVAVVVALLAGGLVVIGLVRVVGGAQQSLQSQFVRTCAANGTAAHDVAAGDTVCGYRLGATVLAAACSAGGGVPDGLQAWLRIGSSGSKAATDITSDEMGCELDPDAGYVKWFATTNSEPADIVVIADYVPGTDWGLVGIDLGCTTASCVGLSMDPAGAYRIDEKRAEGDQKNIAKGVLPVAAVSRLGELNRVVVRYSHRSMQVFLDGYSVVKTTVSADHTSGDVLFVMNDVIGTQQAIVHLRSLQVFEAA